MINFLFAIRYIYHSLFTNDSLILSLIVSTLVVASLMVLVILAPTSKASLKIFGGVFPNTLDPYHEQIMKEWMTTSTISDNLVTTKYF